MSDYFIAGLMCLAKCAAILAAVLLAIGFGLGVVYLLHTFGAARIVVVVILGVLGIGLVAGFVACVRRTVQEKRATGKWVWMGPDEE
jgi:hypothetical protein